MGIDIVLSEFCVVAWQACHHYSLFRFISVKVCVIVLSRVRRETTTSKLCAYH